MDNPILEPAGEALRVDVISDVVCPWCYVGKRQLEAALARWREAHPGAPEPLVRWHPFQLNPDLPEEGVARADYLRMKFGTPDPSSIYQRVGAAARAVGLAPEFEKIARQPNTLRAHALVGAAHGEAQQAVVERLFRAYFMEGADLTARDTLEALAREAGLSDEAIREALDGEGAQQAALGDTEARRLGVSGVPFFVIDGKLGVSGAQGADALVSAFEQARGG
ncbi:DsbA family oxidoreductase [Burkholderiaceae bacterium FT117]|uniref:DsbA family oxidoreductase n=1 Tax=Zeimonas sediminis TaxID=2944268 RepID=UPI002342FA28|nr:DsbA family oxidoreductase [Zeimonas sediminis]MCM5570345.1 DsbA family oxidoreductase [Zeimonas sediminis]